MHAGWVLRIAVPMSVLVAPAIAVSCGSYGDYSSLREVADGSTRRAGGNGGGQAGSGGKVSGSGGLLPPSSGGRAGEAGTRGGTGGSPGDSGSEAGDDGARRDASGAIVGDADASSESSTPPPADIMDGATLQPIPSVSSCGWHMGPATSSGETLIVDFGCSDVLNDFKYVDAGVIVPGDWQYDTTGDPNLAQLANAQSFPTRGIIAVLSGAKALYMPKILHDGKVSVRTWSTDDDSACLVMRYQDEVHYYRLCLSFAVVQPRGQMALIRVYNNQAIELGRYRFTSDTLHVSPGHVLGLEAVGQSFRAYLDGTRVIAADDPGGYSFGRVGVEDILLQDAHFDDFTVVTY
jgi:hypothetical protein